MVDYSKCRMQRQGDILFIKVDKLPEGANSAGKVLTLPIFDEDATGIILEGKTTGHTHALKLSGGQLLQLVEVEEADQRLKKAGIYQTVDLSTIRQLIARGVIAYAVLEQPTQLVHPQHRPHILTPGIWEIRRQRVLAGENARYVED